MILQLQFEWQFRNLQPEQIQVLEINFDYVKFNF